MNTTLDDVMRLQIFLKRYPNLTTENNLRWMIYNRKTNGLATSGAVRKVNGCWYIVLPKLLAYLTGEEAEV